MSEGMLPNIIADQLRREILRGELSPGAPVKEREQATARAVSRTPMREAIRILANEGLILLRPSRSPVVANPTYSEISEHVEVLRALELLSGELACERAERGEIAAIRALHEEVAEIYDVRDPLEVFEVDMRFHYAIVQAAHNAPLVETYRAYLDRLWRVRYLSASHRRDRERVVRQHGAMVEGIEKGDPKRVRRNIESHLDSLLDNVRALMEPEASETENGRG